MTIVGEAADVIARNSCPLCSSSACAYHEALPWLQRCPSCGLVFRPDAPDDAHAMAEAHYGDEAVIHRTHIRSTLAAIARRRWRWLQSRMTAAAPGRLLEVGCATGEFLHVARQAGWKVTGLEVSASFRKAAAEWHGLDLRDEALTAEPFGPGSFEVVALFHVFEHLPYPGRFLQIAHDVLAPGGWLFLAVPNLKSQTDRVYGPTALHLSKRDHFFHYNTETLVQMVSRNGFAPRAIVTHEPAHHVWAGLYGWLGQRRRSGSAKAAAPVRADSAWPRWRARAPFIAGQLTAPFSWPYRVWVESRGGGHEILALFRKANR